MSTTARSYCRLCQAFCGYELVVENGRIRRLRGDRNDPMSRGYACFKGLRHIEMYNHPAARTRVRRGCGRGEPGGSNKAQGGLPDLDLDVLRLGFLMGTATEVAEAIRARIQGLPVTDIYTRGEYPGAPEQLIDDHITRTFTELLPLLRDVTDAMLEDSPG